MTVTEEVGIWVDGELQDGGSAGGRNSFDTNPRFYALNPAPGTPGLYRPEIRHKYEVAAMDSKTVWSWKPGRGRFPWNLLPRRRIVYSSGPASDAAYACRFSVPVELTIVEEEQAEQVDLLSDPQLDDKMQRAFAAGSPEMWGTYSTPAGRRRYAGGVAISYGPLPVAVAFKLTLRQGNADVVARRDQHPKCLRARANTPGRFDLTPADFQLEELGQYDATIIFTPDPEHAYQAPAIKAIWNGTLEFPVSFSVREDDAAR